jgi:hypothetical protein
LNDNETLHDGQADSLNVSHHPVPKQAWLTETGMKPRDAEAAAEIAVPYRVNPVGEEPERQEMRRVQKQVLASQAGAGRSLGMFSLIMAIASLFVWPLLLGLTAAVLGYSAYRQGARGLGVWSMTIGLLAAAAYVVFIPIYSVLS